jgi:hypothetical protein
VCLAVRYTAKYKVRRELWVRRTVKLALCRESHHRHTTKYQMVPFSNSNVCALSHVLFEFFPIPRSHKMMPREGLVFFLTF